MSHSNRITKFIILPSLLLMLFSATKVHAHPHMFIDNTTNCIFDDNGFKGFWVEWIFDDMFSGSILLDYDMDKDGSFNKKESKTIYEEAFSNLVNFNFLYHINIDGDELDISQVDSFCVDHKEGKLIYSFFIPCKIAAKEEETKMVLLVYDETYFIDVTTDKTTGVNLVENEKVESYINIKDIICDDEMYGELMRRRATIIFMKKSNTE